MSFRRTMPVTLHEEVDNDWTIALDLDHADHRRWSGIRTRKVAQFLAAGECSTDGFA
jgi:hypothetical protein